MQKCRNQKTSEGVVNVLAVALEIRINFLLGKVQGLGPTNVATF